MSKQLTYKSTVLACYIGNFTQAIVVNLTPVIFIPLREQFGLSYSQFGLLVLTNFITQVLTDILFSKAVDKYGFRPFAVSGHALCALGLLLFAVVPWLFAGHVYTGLLLATVLFSAGGGLLELLLSPIVDALPGEEKAKAMAMLHSFYAWGQVAVVVVTTLFIFAFGGRSWPVIAALWAAVPLLNTFLFSKVPLAQKDHGGNPMKIRQLLVNPVFLLAFLAILFGGAAEITMSQWSSSFLQKGMNLPKIVGDMLGMCGFAVMLGVGRLIYGLYGHKMDINRIMIFGALLAAVCYVTVALSPWQGLSLAACGITGLAVSLLWPGTLTEASSKLPLAGASMFALLAAGGDIGCSVGPMITGFITDAAAKLPIGTLGGLAATPEQLGLRIGILCATGIPLLAMMFQLLLRKAGNKQKT